MREKRSRHIINQLLTMQRLEKLLTASTLGLLFPLLASAQEFEAFVTYLSTNINRLVVFLVLIATVMLIFGIVRYISAGGDEDKVAEARNLIIYGIIGLAVIIMIWGFVRVLVDFVFDPTTDFDLPDASELPEADGTFGDDD